MVDIAIIYLVVSLVLTKLVRTSVKLYQLAFLDKGLDMKGFLNFINGILLLVGLFILLSEYYSAISLGLIEGLDESFDNLLSYFDSVKG